MPHEYRSWITLLVKSTEVQLVMAAAMRPWAVFAPWIVGEGKLGRENRV